ncbi:ribonuclease HII [Pantanalinema rosaneae CENA516]|uniref:ribonuclease HII n=1 Tax=Pantanalinema rosaneae TaxID=1620701 RepID=UPI003D6E1E2B
MPRSTPSQQLAIPGLTEWKESYQTIAGVDEVGRGALFGPVVAAAVILPEAAVQPLLVAGVTDSKQLSADQRTQLAIQIPQLALDCRIGYASVREIDRLNILQASLLAMKRAILRLKVQPDLCLVDGNQRIPGLEIPQQTIVKGDQRSLAIAAASILAKVWRDSLITRLAVKYPQYDLGRNKGYGTPSHRLALSQYGASCYHRRSFSPCRSPDLSSYPAEELNVGSKLV